MRSPKLRSGTSFAGIALALSAFSQVVAAAISPSNAVFFLDARHPPGDLHLTGGARPNTNGWLQFTSPVQFAEIPFSGRLDGVAACSIGGWFYLQRRGEQVLFGRGAPETAPGGERVFPRAANWVNFFLGTDSHGFLMGCINGNSRMPFPLVTLSPLTEGQWHQIVMVKDLKGGQRFYRNGELVHSDLDAEPAGHVWPFLDVGPGQPIRLAAPLGGRIGEAWIFAGEISASEIRSDFERKKDRYFPAVPGVAVALREMDSISAAGLWRNALTADSWVNERERIRRAVLDLLGPFPKSVSPLEPQMGPETDCGLYVRRRVSLQVQPEDRMPAWLLVPKKIKGRVPAIVCFYGTTSGAGKDTTVGLSGAKPGSPPVRNRAFAVDMAEAGFVALAPDFLRDGERVPPSGRPYDTTDFYRRFPEWSCGGKDVWDTMRAIDYLQTLPFVDPDKIGMVGHSYGGHTTIFTSALEPRIKAAFASGPVSDFRGHGMHWAVPRGAGNSQSLPNLRPYLLEPTRPLPVEFYEWTALIAPRPLWVNQAVGERRPHEEENYAAVKQVYETLGARERVHYAWCAGDHDFPPPVRAAAVQWFKRWLSSSGPPSGSAAESTEKTP